MKLAPQKLSLALGALALLLAGCPKQPARPVPSDTGLGVRAIERGTGPIDTPFPRPPIIEGPEPRPPGWDGPQNRSLLQAQTIYFDFDKFDIKPAEREKLKIAKDYLDKNPAHRLLLEGRCDWRGTAEYNLSLGDKRAASVKKYLQTLGVKPDRLETLSKGSLEAAKNADDATMAKDRRVELIVVDPTKAMTNPL